MACPKHRCAIPMCPNSATAVDGGTAAILAGREVRLCALHTAQARGAVLGAGRGLLEAAKRRAPGLWLAIEAAAKLHRASQLRPEPEPEPEPEEIVVEAKVVR